MTVSVVPVVTGAQETCLANVSAKVDSLSQELRRISLTLHENPELCYEEFIAHETVCAFLETQTGWEVTRAVYGIETAFLAIFENGNGGESVSFNAEYDALPGIGHACGHNLIAVSSIGAALAVADVMVSRSINGKVYLIGTPAEEGGGGKVKLIEAGLYNDHKMLVSLMCHPTNGLDVALCRSTAVSMVKVEYFGREAHAAMCAHQGINALDSMIAAHNNIALARQQLLPGDVISGYITNGGSAINIIPAYTSASFATRAPSKQRLAAVNERLYQCFEAGALASGAKVEITKGNQYDDHVPNKLIGGSYRHWFNLLGGHIPAPEIDLVNGLLPGGTDQGNVSHIIPSLHGVFHIHSEVGIHSADFALAAKTEGAHEKAMVVAKALALTGLDFLTCQDLIDELRNDFPLI